MEELIGKKLGSYQIEEKIGQGGMAVIYKAHQFSLARDVAIKVLPPIFARQDPNFVKRFEREARSIARLNHPHILPVYDFGVEGDYSYIVMRYVEGSRTLVDLMRQSPPTHKQAIDLISQIAKGLAYAHKQGVIHRDIKPSNVLIDDGWVLLFDFGLAKVSEAATQLTGSRIAIGTPAYMSPEQGQGDKIDHRTDIYALGIILYEMLTGTIPHKSDTPWTIMMKRANESPIPPRKLDPTIPLSIEHVLLRSLATKPEHRYRKAEDFEKALQKAVVDDSYREILIDPADETATVASAPESPTPPHIAEPPIRLARRQLLGVLPGPIWAIIATVALVGLLIFIGFIIGDRNSASQSMGPPPLIDTPTNTPRAIVANILTSTHTPTVTPTQTPTNTPVTPSPTAEPTNTPVPAPPTPSQTPTATPPLPTPTPTNTLSPTNTPAPPTATPTVTSTSASAIPSGTFALLNPVGLAEPSFGPTEFEWQWVGTVPPEMGFEVSVWREGEPQAGIHDAVLDNKEGNIQSLGENTYRITVDITDAPGVQRHSGEYLWTVALVQITPNYATLGQQATPTLFRFELPGGSGGGDENGGSGGGAIIN